jgi:type IV pilus assembly protein PilO
MAITLEDFNRIDPNNMGSLPAAVKAVLLFLLLILLIGGGYWFMWSPELEELDTSIHKESELREVYVKKKREAVNLPAYQQQMIDIERIFGGLLKQLPDKSQMDALITDINQAGLERGLEFELFKPGVERPADFYAEMPITIRVVGSYHDLGAFATDISKLSRIVTLNEISITPMVGSKDPKEARLTMDAVAKTFRYLDSNELAAKKKTEKKGSKSP